MQKLKLTNVAIEKLNKVIELKKQKLRELGQYKASAAENEGDAWHDNFAFEQTEIQERALIREINDLQKQIDCAEIIEIEKNEDVVNIGSNVTVIIQFLEEDFEEYSFTLDSIGDSEKNIVSINSPLGECVFGKSLGFEGNYKVNENIVHVKITSIIN